MRQLMLMNRLLYSRTHAVLVMCMLSGFPCLLTAAPQEEAITDEAEDAVAPAAETSSPIQNLDEGISMEERMQLRRDLVQYSRAVDPSHIQIEERRRLMRKRIQERFLGSDKDNDGTISREEAAETLPQIFRHFSQVDINDDGVVSVGELEAAQARAIERRRVADEKIEAAAQGEDDALKRKNRQASANGKNDL